MNDALLVFAQVYNPDVMLALGNATATLLELLPLPPHIAALAGTSPADGASVTSPHPTTSGHLAGTSGTLFSYAGGSPSPGTASAGAVCSPSASSAAPGGATELQLLAISTITPLDWLRLALIVMLNPLLAECSGPAGLLAPRLSAIVLALPSNSSQV